MRRPPRRTRRYSRIFAIGITTIALSCVGLTTASAAGVQCGQTVTRDTRLTKDLKCAGDGLLIGAAGVTLDLGGHTITGTGGTGTSGILNSGHDGVTLKNGSVLSFGRGVSLADTKGNTLRFLTVSGNSDLGAFLLRTSGTTVAQNRISRSGPHADGPGLLLFQSDHNDLLENRLSSNGDGILLLQSSHNRVEKNTSSRSGAGIGILDASHDNEVQLNVTNDNSDTGILLDNHADDNRLERNAASGNAFVGVVVGASDRNSVQENVTNDNLGSGIAVTGNAQGTLVKRNVAIGNGFSPYLCQPDCPFLDDGIYVDAPRTTVTGNVAVRNADLGIEAVPGVTDGGGNTAIRNGNTHQCSVVVCRP